MSARDARSWRIVFDGGSLGNPGDGYGSYRLAEPGGDWLPPVKLDYGSPVTNNEAEYRTLTEGLRALAELCGDPSSARVVVLGDSRLVLEQLAGRWRVRAANLRPFHAEAKAEVGRFGEVELRWQGRERSVELLGH